MSLENELNPKRRKLWRVQVRMPYDVQKYWSW